MNLVAAAVLGAVQGLTEFLPVSSSAHLILGRLFFGWNPEAALGKAFDVACHVGTLSAVLVYFRAEIGRMIAAVPHVFSVARREERDLSPEARKASGDVRRLWLIALGTVPIVIVGALWSDAVDAVRTPLVAAIALVIGSVFLLVVERLGPRFGGEDTLSPAGALAIGAAQSVALVPGISRSGITIATGMALGLRRDAAARFTFLMSIPAIVAAAAKEGMELRSLHLGASDAAVFGVGMATSAVVGYVAVKYFIRFLAAHRLDVFAWYRLGLAALTFAWLAAR